MFSRAYETTAVKSKGHDEVSSGTRDLPPPRVPLVHRPLLAEQQKSVSSIAIPLNRLHHHPLGIDSY